MPCQISTKIFGINKVRCYSTFLLLLLYVFKIQYCTLKHLSLKNQLIKVFKSIPLSRMMFVEEKKAKQAKYLYEYRRRPEVRERAKLRMREIRAAKRIQGLPVYTHKLHEKICPICKSQFKARKSRKTCSLECGRKLRLQGWKEHNEIPRAKRFEAEGKTEKEILALIGAKKKRSCVVCGNEYFSKSDQTKTCSQTCGFKIRLHYKGGRIETKAGYVKIKMRDHPYVNSRGYVNEHRLVMEKSLEDIFIHLKMFTTSMARKMTTDKRI